MNNKYLYTLLSMIAMAAAMNDAMAQWQPIVDYPNPNYLYQEIPCPEKITPYWGFSPHQIHTESIFLPKICDSVPDPWAIGCPFLFKGEDSTKTVTIKGVAVSLFCRNQELKEFSYELDKDHDVTVVIYKASFGTPELQVVKEQTFHIDRGKEPDIIMKYPIYQGSDPIYDSYDPTDPINYYKYFHEFYFDQPVTVRGFFIIIMIEKFNTIAALREGDKASLAADRQELFSLHRERIPDECRIPGFDPYINFCSDTVLGLYNIYNRHEIYTTIPDWDSTRLMTPFEQAYFPILQTNDIDQANGQSSMRVQPNPARDKVNVTSEEGILHLEVIDMNGRTLIRRTCGDMTQSVTLDISHLPRGTYAVRMKTDRTTAIEKLVVE